MRIPVERASLTVSAFGQEEHLKLKTDGAVATEIVFLDVRRMPLKRVMAKIANVTGAVWVQAPDGGYVLGRPDWLVQSIEKEDFERKLQVLNQWRHRLVNHLKLPFTAANLASLVRERAVSERESQGSNSTENEREHGYDLQNDLNLYDPIYRALARCIKDLPMGQVAGLDTGQFLTFALRPNRVQIGLPTSSCAALTQLQPEQRAWGEALSKLPGLLHKSSRDTFFFGSSAEQGDRVESDSGPWQNEGSFVPKPTRMTLFVSCDADEQFSFEIRMYTDDWAPVLDFDCNGVWTVSFPNRPLRKFLSPVPSRETSAFEALLGWPGKAHHDRSALAPFLRDPVHNDPLRLGNEEILETIAASRRKSVIACLPDDLGMWAAEQDLIAGYIYSQPEFVDASLEEDRTCIAIRPRSFVDHWRERTNRTAYAQNARLLLHRGKIGLLDFIQSLATTADCLGGYGARFLEDLDPEAQPPFSFFEKPTEEAFTFLLASLSAQQLETLERGLTIPYACLTLHQQHLCAQIIYGPRVNVDEAGTCSMHAPGDIPTHEFPNGILSGGGLSAMFGTEPDNAPFFTPNIFTVPDFSQLCVKPLPKGHPVIRSDIRKVVLRCEMEPGHFILGRFHEVVLPRSSGSVKPSGDSF